MGVIGRPERGFCQNGSNGWFSFYFPFKSCGCLKISGVTSLFYEYSSHCSQVGSQPVRSPCRLQFEQFSGIFHSSSPFPFWFGCSHCTSGEPRKGSITWFYRRWATGEGLCGNHEENEGFNQVFRQEDPSRESVCGRSCFSIYRALLEGFPWNPFHPFQVVSPRAHLVPAAKAICIVFCSPATTKVQIWGQQEP